MWWLHLEDTLRLFSNEFCSKSEMECLLWDWWTGAKISVLSFVELSLQFCVSVLLHWLKTYRFSFQEFIVYGVHNILVLCSCIFKWLFFSTGQVKASTFIFAFVADTCIVGFLFCFAFLTFHLILLSRGTTTKEWFGGHATEYDNGWKKNFKNFLGERWYLVWLSPWIQSRLPGDGINFELGHLSTTVPSMKSTQ